MSITVVVIIGDVRQAEETWDVVLDHPADSNAHGVALLGYSLHHVHGQAAHIRSIVEG